MIITQQLSMSITTLEEKIVDINVRLKQAMTANFQNIVRRIALNF